MSAGIIKLTPKIWEDICALLREEYRDRPSVLLIRSRMKEELGFTVRKHKINVRVNEDDLHVGFNYPELEIYLDFDDSAKEVFFRMKYL